MCIWRQRLETNIRYKLQSSKTQTQRIPTAIKMIPTTWAWNKTHLYNLHGEWEHAVCNTACQHVSWMNGINGFWSWNCKRCFRNIKNTRFTSLKLESTVLSADMIYIPHVAVARALVRGAVRGLKCSSIPPKNNLASLALNKKSHKHLIKNTRWCH